MPTAVPLSQLVDLALGSPEVGAVNFNVLHTLLHAMIQKLSLQDVKADIDEHDRELLSTHAFPRPFSVFSSDSGKGDDSFSVVSEDNLSEKSGHGVKRSPYHKLEKQVAEIAKQMEELNKLPSNEQLMGKNESKDNERQISNMWQYMQLKKRVDANEEGVGKLMTLFEDLMKEIKDIKDEQRDLRNKVDGIDLDVLKNRLAEMEKAIKDVTDKYDGLSSKLSSLPTFDDLDQFLNGFVTWPGLEDALKGVKQEFENLQPVAEERVVIELGTQTDGRRSSPRPQTVVEVTQSTQEEPKVRVEVVPEISSQAVEDGITETDELIDGDRDDLPLDLQSIHSVQSEALSRPASSRGQSRASSMRTPGPSPELLDVLEKLGKLVEDHERLRRRVDELERLLKEKADKSDLVGLGGGPALEIPENITATLEKLQNELKELQENQIKDEAAIKRLQEAIRALEQEINKLKNSMETVIDENSKRVKEIEDLVQYCDSLSEKKADKSYVDMEVDVKADKDKLEDKVSHSLFDSTTSELNRLIQDILDKLNGQEENWKAALARVMKELDGKLDRMELNNLRDWLEKQLKALNNKIKNMGSSWNIDDEAAGMRKQLIQKFHCLSCDKAIDVIPQPPISSIPANYGMPKSKSPRPYTTFELDQIRQHAKSLGVSPEMADYYATIRQCGGSHTLTYPHKRMAKMNQLGQVIKEEETIMPMYKEEVDVQGMDGHIYKGRVENARIEAKLPTSLATQQSTPIYMERQASPQPPKRPVSARVRSASARPSSSGSHRVTAQQAYQTTQSVADYQTTSNMRTQSPSGDNVGNSQIQDGGSPAAQIEVPAPPLQEEEETNVNQEEPDDNSQILN